MGLRRCMLSGSYFEVGRLLGERMRAFERPAYGLQELRFADACAREVERYFPEALEKLEGIVAGSGLEPDQFRCHFLTKGAAVAACVGVVVGTERSVEGEPLVGRNYHWPLSDRVWCELRETRVVGELPHVGYTHHWGGLPDVLNAAGLYVAIFSVPQLAQRQPGLQWHIITDYLASRSHSVEEAREFLLAAPHLRSFSYLVADASGGALAAEATPAGVTVREAEEGVLVVTNHHVEGQAPSQGRERSRALYQGVRRRLGDRAVWSWQAVRELVADHELGVCVGDHGGTSEGWGTLYGLVVRPAVREFAVSGGFPCREPFERILVPTEVTHR